jgi:hypothetical protein
MGDTNKRKAQTLGMSHGAARNRLVKSIMFRQAQLLGQDICFKCKEVILSIDELSIEHIQPWEGVSVELFFDLENIAFSHLRCNRPDRNVAHLRRKIGPEGTAWCSSHKKFLPVGKFSRSIHRWNGYTAECLECRNKTKKDRRKRGLVG